MRVSLLTIWHIGNYGAELQTYCTVQVLKELGHHVRVVRYDLKESTQGNASQLKQLLFNMITGLMPANIKSQLFWNFHIPSTRKYNSPNDFYKNPPKADAYIVGSDQVWNPDITRESSPLYFLDFVPQGCKKISYASSFGEAEWKGDSNITEIAKRNLLLFDNVSCRETSGVEILNKVFNISAQCVLDPTLIVNDYSKLIGKVEEKNVLLYYPLNPNFEVEHFCKTLSKELNLSLKIANKKTVLRRCMLWNKPSVIQWLKSIGEAKFIVTPSFHGLTTSIKLHRNFAILITEPLILKRSARVRDLLELLDLSDRLFTSIEDLYASRIWEKNIDYCKVDNLLKIEREKSYKYLEDCLR